MITERNMLMEENMKGKYEPTNQELKLLKLWAKINHYFINDLLLDKYMLVLVIIEIFCITKI